MKLLKELAGTGFGIYSMYVSFATSKNKIHDYDIIAFTIQCFRHKNVKINNLWHG